jgi:DNA ligase-1
MKILYKKDSKGKIRIFEIKTNYAILVQRSGLKDGKLVEHIKVCKGKNIGKSNETTPEQQAILEMESEAKSKLTEGYFKTVKEAEDEVVILPMLAKSYNDEKHKIDWSNCYIQPKLDGMRCLAKITKEGYVTLISRDGKIIQNMEHIMDELSRIRQDVILDGELYAHGLTFQENMKLLKKYRLGETEKIKYHIYDLVSDKQFSERNIRSYIKNLNTCEEVSTYKITSEIQLKAFHSQFVEMGYEGSIIRWGNEGYKVNGRSSYLLKYKDFQDIALPIIDITPNDSNPLHGTPHFELNGKSFKAGCKMSHDDRADLLKNGGNYIGKMAEIRYFELTNDGIPRFPVMVGIRLDK